MNDVDREKMKGSLSDGGQVGFQPNANKLFNFWTPSTIAAHKRNVVSGRKAAGFRQTNQSTLHSYLRDKVK